MLYAHPDLAALTGLRSKETWLKAVLPTSRRPVAADRTRTRFPLTLVTRIDVPSTRVC